MPTTYEKSVDFRGHTAQQTAYVDRIEAEITTRVERKKYVPKKIKVKVQDPRTYKFEEKEYFDDSDFWLSTTDYTR